MRILPYMDDFLACFSTRQAAEDGAVQLRRTCVWLGLALSDSKCIWTPTQVIDHLGLRIDTKRGLFLVPPAKEAKIRGMALGIIQSSYQHRRLISARHLASFTGLAQSVYLAVPTARLYLRSLHDVIGTKYSWNARVRL
jgi:hypothetical protein